MYSLTPFRNDDAALRTLQEGMALADQGMIEPAIQTFKKVLRTQPKNQAVLENLAELYAEKGAQFEAVHYWFKTLKNDPEYAFGWQRLGLMFLYDANTIAQQCFEQCRRIDPKFPDIDLLTARAMRQNGHHQKARLVLERALETDSKDIYLQLELAELLLEEYNTVGARSILKHILKLEPGYPRANYLLAATCVTEISVDNHDTLLTEALGHLSKAAKEARYDVRTWLESDTYFQRVFHSALFQTWMRGLEH